MPSVETVTPLLPPEIQTGFFGDSPVKVEKLGGGMINTNLKVRPMPGEPVIVQMVSDIFDAEPLARDINRVTDHLRQENWEVPSLLKGVNGEVHQRDAEGNPWRAMTFINSDPTPNSDPHDTEVMRKCGALLARWHVSMQSLDYIPEHTLEHFHDTAYYFAEFEKLAGLMPDNESRTLSKEVLSGMRSLPPLPEFGDQLLHGDPRTDNMLFRDGQPFTFIDFDTVMHGPIWIDLGDMLRSLGENAILAGEPVQIKTLEAVIESYRAQAYPDGNHAEFKLWGMAAMKLIAGELTMRFLNDYVEQKRFKITQEERLSLANVQWAVFNSVALEIDPVEAHE